MGTVADLFKKNAPQTAASILTKSAEVTASISPLEGSMEHFIARVRPFVEAVAPCRVSPPLVPVAPGSYPYTHYPSLHATFADHGIVRCYDCAKAWKVPFTIDDGDVVTVGAPEERVEAFISPDSIAASDGDGDEPEDTDTQD